MSTKTLTRCGGYYEQHRSLRQFEQYHVVPVAPREASSMTLWLGVIGWSIGALLGITDASAVESPSRYR